MVPFESPYIFLFCAAAIAEKFLGPEGSLLKLGSSLVHWLPLYTYDMIVPSGLR